MAKHWIRKLKKGALTLWAMRNAKKIKTVTGHNAFTQEGDLNDIALKILLKKHKEGKVRLSNTTVKRIVTKFTLDKLRKKRRR